MKRSHGRQFVKGRVYGRFWLGGAARESVPLPALKPTDDAAVEARCRLIADITAKIVDAGRPDRARDFAVLLGEATSQKRIAEILRSVDGFLKVAHPIGLGETVRQFGDRWISGELARLYPDHVRVKSSADDDRGILEKYVYPEVGGTPLRAFALEDAERVMAGIPADRSRARRRHVAQAMSRLLNLAVYPARVIDRSPLPRGFLPKLGHDKAKQFLYPDEDSQLMACDSVPLAYRLFYGVSDREGMRYSEAQELEWADLDLERGVVRLDENKTNDPRSWALDPSVASALRAWKQIRGGIGPFVRVRDSHPADVFREHLQTAGVTRRELYERTPARVPIRAHDLRATFVTLALANGRTETWVADRTGHKSTQMIARYRRAARTVSELSLGNLQPLREAIVWNEVQQSTSKPAASGRPHRHRKGSKTPGTEGGTRTLTPVRTADFETDLGSSDVAPRAGAKPSDDVARRGARSFASSLQDLAEIRGGWSAYEVTVDGMAQDEGPDATDSASPEPGRGSP